MLLLVANFACREPSQFSLSHLTKRDNTIQRARKLSDSQLSSKPNGENVNAFSFQSSTLPNHAIKPEAVKLGVARASDNSRQLQFEDQKQERKGEEQSCPPVLLATPTLVPSFPPPPAHPAPPVPNASGIGSQQDLEAPESPKHEQYPQSRRSQVEEDNADNTAPDVSKDSDNSCDHAFPLALPKAALNLTLNKRHSPFDLISKPK